MMNQLIKAIIVDDEPVARERLSMLLEVEDQIVIAGAFDNGIKALDFLKREEVDLALIDVQMPGLDGIGLLKALPETHQPHVILVTAYDDHALTAYDLSVVDYLLKPYSKDRFRQALEKFYLVKKGELSIQNHADYEPAQVLNKVAVKLGNRTYFISVAEIEYVEAAGNYLELFAGGKVHVIRETMMNMIRRLPEHFLRIHKSNIVNVDFIRELISIGYGDYELKMSNGKVLRVSDSYKKQLLGVLSC